MNNDSRDKWSQIQSPSSNFLGKNCSVRYWKPYELKAWISAFSPVRNMSSISSTHAGFFRMNGSFKSSSPVFLSWAEIGKRHCSGKLYLSRSEGRTPSHLISEVVRLLESYDLQSKPQEMKVEFRLKYKQKYLYIFFDPLQYTERILRPYGSLSTRARTGILSWSVILRKKRRVATSGWPFPVMTMHGYFL